MYGPEYDLIISEICKRNGIDLQEVGNCKLLKRSGITVPIWSRRFSLNSAPTARIIDSKWVCSALLELNHVPSVQHKQLSNPSSQSYQKQAKSNQTICEDLLQQHGGVVIKPNDAYEGKGVCACFSSKEVESALLKGFQQYSTLVVSPFIDICSEYRVFYLAGTCLLAYKKILPTIQGDGVSTVAQLISALGLEKDDILKTVNLDQVLPLGTPSVIGWKYNLSRGSSPQIISDEKLEKKLYDLAQQAAETVNGEFMTVDIIEEKESHLFRIIEINSGVAMDQFIIKHKNGRQIAYNIYEKAVNLAFQKQTRII